MTLHKAEAQMSALNNCRMQTLCCRQHGPAWQPPLGQYGFDAESTHSFGLNQNSLQCIPPKPKPDQKCLLLSDLVPKAKFGWPLAIALFHESNVTRSAGQCRKWQLIIISRWYCSALCGHLLSASTTNTRPSRRHCRFCLSCMLPYRDFSHENLKGLGLQLHRRVERIARQMAVFHADTGLTS